MSFRLSQINLLRCPVCHAPMQTDDGRVCKCMGAGKTHCFDFARSGYLNLAGSHAGEGDLKEAVLSRRAFLDAGYYQPLADWVCKLIKDLYVTSLLDAGCGEGYYTNRMSEICNNVIGMDLSRDGIDYASRRARQNLTGAAFAVGSIFKLPMLDESFDAVTNIFAPCCEAEFFRVLKDRGYLILVGAGERHLFGFKQVLYENPYINQGRSDLPEQLMLLEKQNVHSEICVNSHEHIEALFSMTPYYWRTSPHDRAKLEQLEALTTEVDFDIFIYQKR